MQKELDTICAEAFARLDALDLAMYHRGFVTRQNTRPKIAEAIGADKTKRPKGPTALSVSNPKSPSYL
jgi:hypothetical protein